VAGARVSIQGGGAESDATTAADGTFSGSGASRALVLDDGVPVIVRASGSQYDDDLNLFPLGRATIVDLLVGQNVGRGLELYAAAESLLDDRYDIARTPVLSLGLPRTLRAGIRIQASSRP
jgi:hypothetical protein